MLNLKKWMAKISDMLVLKVYHSGTVDHATRISVYRIGRNAVLDVVGLKNLPTGQFITICTIPHEFSPIINVEQDEHSVGGTVGSIRVNVESATGKVNVYNYNGPTSGAINLRCQIPFICWGGVKGYLLHLTESLKSFAGRRWAYAESEEDADEDVREDRRDWHRVHGGMDGDIEQCECNTAYRYHNSSCRDIYFAGDYSACINREFWYLRCRKILKGIWYGRRLFFDNAHDNWNIHIRKKRTVCTGDFFIYRAWFPDSNSHCITTAPERGWLCA